MKSEIKLIKFAQKNLSNNDYLDQINEKLRGQGEAVDQRALDEAEKKANRYSYIKQKAKEMNLSIRDYIEFFGTNDDRKFLELADREEKPDQNEVSIEQYNKVLELFEFLKKTSEEKNIPIRSVLENLNVGGEMLGKLSPLVLNYERLMNEQQRIQKENNERIEAERIQKINSPEERLRTSTDRARFFTEEWNKVIEDAKAQNMDPVTYVRIHYPESLAYEIIAWHMLKSGQKTPENIHEYLASLVNDISDEQVQKINQEYSENVFENLVDEAREVIENIDWEKVGAYLSDGVNNVIYQLLKPGSIIKKTADSIRAIVSLLTLKNSEQFSEEYEQEQINRERARQELDEYLNKKQANKMNKKQIIASLNNIANELDNGGFYRESNTVTNVMKRLAQETPSDFENPNSFDIKNEKDENKGRNIVKSISKMIYSLLKDDEKARKDFSGGELQSFILSILDVFMQDGMGEAIKEINKSLKTYGVMIGGEEITKLGQLFNSYRSIKNLD